MNAEHDIPLCVDLDGTLLKSDSLMECIAGVLRRHPFVLLLIPYWLLRGRAHMKRRLAERIDLKPHLLPYDSRVVGWLKRQRTAGRTIVLATAADERVAEPIARHTGLFSGIVCSDGSTNLKGSLKLQALHDLFPGGFAYAGDSRADLKVWRGALEAIMVNESGATLRAARRQGPVTMGFERETHAFPAGVRAMRLYQWVKNLLVLVPLATSHTLLDPRKLLAAMLAMLAFGFCASSAYLLNDLVDLESDRQHERKRNRPLANGSLPLGAAFALIPILLLLAGGLCALLPPGFSLTLALYFVLTLSYSLVLKQRLLADVFTLAILYMLRIVGGAAATHIALTGWLLAFSMFLFLSLAFCKRATELRKLGAGAAQAVPGRAYSPEDLQAICMCGICSGFMASLVLTLYLDSGQVRMLYAQPQILWLLLPMVLYWMARIWIFEARGRLHDDPLMFAIKDRITYVLGIACALVLLAASRDWASIPGSSWSQ